MSLKLAPFGIGLAMALQITLQSLEIGKGALRWDKAKHNDRARASVSRA
jgi:hypothetical protein